MDPRVAAFTVTGLAAATFTPYHEDGSVAPELVDAHCADLAKNKVSAAFINGTTGDSMSLSVAERKVIAEAWVASGKAHGVTIINHIGANSVTDAKELAAHAEASGCAAISAMPPFFFKPPTARVLALWLKEVGAAAPSLPLYYYYFPDITGVTIDPHALLLAVEEVGVPTFRGFKFTHFNLWQYSNCVRHGGGRYDCAYGRDEAMLGGLATGAKASIGNAFCFSAGIYHRLRAAFFKGDMATAQAEQGRSCTVVNMMQEAKYGGLPLVISRHILELKGVKVGPPRAPFQPMTDAQKALLEADLRAIGFFEWCD